MSRWSTGPAPHELLAEPRGRVALALRDVAAPLLCDPPLLLGELRERVGAQPRERVLELGRALRDLLRHDLVERGSAALDLALEQALVRSHLAQHEHARDEREHGETAATTATIAAAVTASS